MAAAFEGNFVARGSVTLKSTDPKDPPVIDPKFLVEPFDRRVAIEAVRETLKLLDTPQLVKDQVRLAAGPENQSDEAILVRWCIQIPMYAIGHYSRSAYFTGLCPQDGDEYVALQRYCPNG